MPACTKSSSVRPTWWRSDMSAPHNRPSTLALSRRLARYAWRRRVAMSGVGATMLVNVGLTVIKPWPMKVLVDNVLRGKPLHGTAGHVFAALPGPATRDALLWYSVGATVLLFVLGWAASLGSQYAGIRFGQRLVYDVGGDLFHHLQRLSLRYHGRNAVG